MDDDETVTHGTGKPVPLRAADSRSGEVIVNRCGVLAHGFKFIRPPGEYLTFSLLPFTYYPQT